MTSTLSVIVWHVVGRAEETSIYSCQDSCTVQKTTSYQLSYRSSVQDLNSDLRGECITNVPPCPPAKLLLNCTHRGARGVRGEGWLVGGLFLMCTTKM